MSYRVVIPTAGTGSRLGLLTQHVNKSLVSLANRSVICHVIEQFPADTDFVVALGHKGQLVREFLLMAYPRRRFLFAEVQPYEGTGSGLGRSLLCCEGYLRQPFVFCSCDTMVDEPVDPPDHNWMGYAPSNDTRSYRTLRLAGERVTDICEKNVRGPVHGAYIGLCGVANYQRFWHALRQGGDEAVQVGEVHGLRHLLGTGIRAKRFTWWDTGTPAALEDARGRRQPEVEANILEKNGEAIWFVNGTVIKFSVDEEFIRQRVRRAGILEGYVPDVIAHTGHMYQYQRLNGQVLSEVIDLPLFRRFLEHARGFWTLANLSAIQIVDFKARCARFYREKTLKRVRDFFAETGTTDTAVPINGESVPSAHELLEQVDWAGLEAGLPGRYHGDFHFENILWLPDEQQFAFLDWRQDFDGDVETGDIYYDLAKLLHGLIVNHEIVLKELYDVQWTEEAISFDLLRKQVLVDCEREYYTWLDSCGYDVRRVRILTALVFLNIAALHHHPYRLMVFALGKLLLKRGLDSTWR